MSDYEMWVWIKAGIILVIVVIVGFIKGLTGR